MRSRLAIRNLWPWCWRLSGRIAGGACRQFAAEFRGDLPILIIDADMRCRKISARRVSIIFCRINFHYATATQPWANLLAANLLAIVESAVAANKLSASAAKNIRRWLTEPRYAPYRGGSRPADRTAGQWKELDDAFWTVIPFGTGGRRGKMYPIGSNTINDRTIGESAQGLADYVATSSCAARQRRLRCAIAYDTRHQSRHFAELCSEIMAAAGFKVFFLDGFRSTPELSFAVRHLRCHCGIMVTRQPQSAERQRGESLLVDRRTNFAAARRGD